MPSKYWALCGLEVWSYSVCNYRVPYFLLRLLICYAPLIMFLLFFCFPKRKSKQKKRGFFCYRSARKKSSSTLLTQFAYQLHALKLLPLLGAIALLYAWGLFASIAGSCIVSPAKIKAQSWAELQRAYNLYFINK